MRRRHFLRNTGIVLFGTLLFPSILSFYSARQLEAQELMGIKRPDLHGDNFNLVKPAAVAFEKMRAAALEDGIKMYSQSSYRSFAHQKRIWDRKYTQYTSQGLSPQKSIQKIIRYSTIPGTSRHHWGTDLDIVDRAVPYPANPLNEQHYHDGGAYVKLGNWLRQHAESYGFYLVYTNQKDRKGFEYEPWHYSFREAAVPRLRYYLDQNLLYKTKKAGIKGDEHISDVLLEQYLRENVKDINPELLP
jgi:LAS superfamily LD-carboxypeptidase LdcB